MFAAWITLVIVGTAMGGVPYLLARDARQNRRTF